MGLLSLFGLFVLNDLSLWLLGFFLGLRLHALTNALDGLADSLTNLFKILRSKDQHNNDNNKH